MDITFEGVISGIRSDKAGGFLLQIHGFNAEAAKELMGLAQAESPARIQVAIVELPGEQNFP